MIPAIKINPLISRSTFLMIYCPFGCAACQAAPIYTRCYFFTSGLGLGLATQTGSPAGSIWG